MLDQLKERRYRRRFGPEQAKIILRTERAMRALPPERLSSLWIEWFWRQPPDTWEGLLTLRERGERHPNEPLPPPPREKTPAEILAEAERAREKAKQCLSTIEANSPNLPPIPNERFDRAANLIKGDGPQVNPPWDVWIAALPAEERAKGVHACRIWLEMLDLRESLQDAIHERNTLSGILEDEARRVMDVRMFALRGRIERCEAAYRELAEPFFAQHGRPPLKEGTRSV